MKRQLQFEPMDQRVLLSAGLVHPAVASAAVHDVHPTLFSRSLGPLANSAAVREAVHMAKSATLSGTLKGGESTILPGSSDSVLLGGLSGKLGKVALQSSIFGTISGNNFEGGTMRLSNSQGVMIADLGPGKPMKKGKFDDVKVKFEFEEANGAYSQVVGWAGNVTIELGVNKSSARAVTSGSPASPTKVTDALPALWETDDAELDINLISDVADVLTAIFR